MRVRPRLALECDFHALCHGALYQPFKFSLVPPI
jgi:hypothetical protein